MMELSKRIEEILEKHDFIYNEISERYREKGQYDIDLETYSPEGEDVIVSLTYDGTEEDFIREFTNYANGFDVCEHVEMWVDSRGENGVPDNIRDLLEDAEWIKKIFMEIAKELNNLDHMNRKQFYQYILENFSISREAGALIDNILRFIEWRYKEENEQYRVLCELLGGTIGLSDDEIKRVYM